MPSISQEISELFERLELDIRENSGMVPKSDSAGVPGNLLFFRYRSEQSQRLVMLVKPVTKDARTGNLLLTCVILSPAEYTDKEQLKSLYNNRSNLPEDTYRTFIMSKIAGPLYRITL